VVINLLLMRLFYSLCVLLLGGLFFNLGTIGTAFANHNFTAEELIRIDSTEDVGFNEEGEGGEVEDNEYSSACDPTNPSYEATHCPCKIFIPNTFTPDDDELNDRFSIRHICALQSAELIIFNRWGEELFRTNDLENGWDGKNKGDDVPVDAYVWILHYSASDSEGTKEHKRRGLVRLLR
jgi:gliding motility-associated-like protein